MFGGVVLGTFRWPFPLAVTTTSLLIIHIIRPFVSATHCHRVTLSTTCQRTLIDRQQNNDRVLNSLPSPNGNEGRCLFRCKPHTRAL